MLVLSYRSVVRGHFAIDCPARTCYRQAMSHETELAATLWAARTSGASVPRAAADQIADVTAAYETQRAGAARCGLARAGWKVGATSAVAMEMLGVDGPVTAPMFAPHCVRSGDNFPLFASQTAAIESEFAFRFAADLPSRSDTYSRDEVLAAVGTVMPAFEIIGTRFEGGVQGLGAIRVISDMVANIGWAGAAELENWHDFNFKEQPVKLYKNNMFEAEGTGAAAMGDPLNVLEWTANHLSQQGDGIKAGEVVSTGTCTGVVPVAIGDTLRADFSDLGAIEVTFSEVT